MRTMPNNYYELMDFGLQGTSFQEFVDRFQEKYNTLNADGFVWDPEIQLDYKYEQLIASLGIKTLPIYVNEEDEALDVSRGEFKIGSNKIPTQRQRYPVDAKMMREMLIMTQRFGQANLNQRTKEALLSLMFDSVDTLLGGRTNALTHQRMQIVSTAQFSISLENNPRGITGLTFDFGVPAANKETLSGENRWWKNATHTTANEGTSSDPLLYLKNKVKAMRKNGFPRGHIEMSIDLFDDLLTHSKVLQRIGYSVYPIISSDAQAVQAAQNMTDDALKAAIERIIGCPIVTRDSLAAVDDLDENNELRPKTIENFKPTNVAFVPDGQIGTIKSVQPVVITSDPTQRFAWFDGGRTLITNRYESKTRSMYVESEMAVLCVPQMPQYMCAWVVTV